MLSGRCSPYGDGTTYWPLVEIFREAGGKDELSEALTLEPLSRDESDELIDELLLDSRLDDAVRDQIAVRGSRSRSVEGYGR